MLEWQREGVEVTKQVEVEGKWGDRPLPLLSECNLLVIDCNGPSNPYSQLHCKTGEIVTYVTGFATCLHDRLLELALLSMLEGEQAFISYNPLFTENPSIQVRLKLQSFKNTSAMPEWSADKCLEIVNKLKQKGVEIFQQGRSRDAFYLFSQALRVLTLGEGNILSSTLSCNMAACQLDAGNNEYAAELCEITLDLQPDNRKALYRRGMAAFNLGEFKVAEQYANKVLKLEPSNSQASSLLTKAKEHFTTSTAEYQAVMKRMFN